MELPPPTSYSVADGVATITFLGSGDEKLPWGTPVREHRWDPRTVAAVHKHLDDAAADEAVECVVVQGEGKFWCNGLDLNWVDSHSSEEGSKHTEALNALFERTLTYPLPTVAALNGHWCAAGGMFGLCFDYRVMNADAGFFFVPAIDLGLVYSSFQIELMKAKIPAHMHRKVIVYNSHRWTAPQLLAEAVIDQAVSAREVLPAAAGLAQELRPKGRGAPRRAMGPIKATVYKQVLAALRNDSSKGMMKMGGRSKGHAYPPPAKTSRL